MKKIKVLLADYDDNNRANIRDFMEKDSRIDVVGGAKSPKEIFERVKNNNPEIVLMDKDIEDSLEIIRQLSLQYPNISAIVISGHDDIGSIKEAMLAGAKEYLVKPLSTEELIESVRKVAELNRQRQRLLFKGENDIYVKENISPIRNNKVICVYGTKGGVGKSVICTNLAVVMGNKYRDKVCLLDLDLQFGDACILLDLNPRKTISELMQEGDHIDIDLLEEYLYERNGVHVLAPPNKPELSELVTSERVGGIINLCRERFHFTFIDTPSFIDETTLTALEMADLILLVISLDLPTIKNVKKGLDVLKSLKLLPKTRLILNRSSGVAGIEAMDVEKILDMKIRGEVSSDGKLVVSSVNKGIPFVKLNPKAAISRGITDISGLVESWGVKN